MLQAEIQIDTQGHLVIPVELMQAVNFGKNSAMVARVDGERLILEKRETVKQRVRQRFANIPVELSLVDELIAARRRDADLELI